MEIAIFILEYGNRQVDRCRHQAEARHPHGCISPLQAGLLAESGLEASGQVLVLGFVASRQLGRWFQLNFLPISVVIDFHFGNVDGAVDQGAGNADFLADVWSQGGRWGEQGIELLVAGEQAAGRPALEAQRSTVFVRTMVIGGLPVIQVALAVHKRATEG